MKKDDEIPCIRKEHKFDYSTESPSIFGRSSIQLKYSRYQRKLSPWNTMVDEVRILKIPIVEEMKGITDYDNMGNNKFDYILLGVGSMAWSGGMYNCQPFCLY